MVEQKTDLPEKTNYELTAAARRRLLRAAPFLHMSYSSLVHRVNSWSSKKLIDLSKIITN